MTNKGLSILIIFLLIGVLCMGVVCAKSMETQDFLNFKMDTPDGSNFVEQPTEGDNEFNGVPLSQVAYADDANQIVIYYINSPVFSGEGNSVFYQLFFENVNPDSNQSYEYQEGNLRVLEPVHKSGMTFSLVGLNSGNETLLLFGQDVNLLKDMANTVEF